MPTLLCGGWGRVRDLPLSPGKSCSFLRDGFGGRIIAGPVLSALASPGQSLGAASAAPGLPGTAGPCAACWVSTRCTLYCFLDGWTDGRCAGPGRQCRSRHPLLPPQRSPPSQLAGCWRGARGWGAGYVGLHRSLQQGAAGGGQAEGSRAPRSGL